MARTRPWEVSNELWKRVRPLIPPRPPKPKGGRPPKDDRQMFEALLFVLRTGMQWNALPRAIAASTTVYDRFRLWMADGFFHALWKAGLTEFDEVMGIDWQWQSLDAVMTKAPFGGSATGANPTDRGKRGTKRSQLSEGQGLPIALSIDGANVHDTNLMAVTLDAIILKRPPPTEQPPQHLCLDAGYVGERTEKAVRARGYTPHVRPRGEERGRSGSRDAKKRPRRWVVEKTQSQYP